MASSSPQLDRDAVVAQVLEVVRVLLNELGNTRAEQTVQSSSHLERDLGLGSLERVELLVRLERALGVHLADEVMAHADTVADLVAAVAGGEVAPRAAKGGPSSLEVHKPELSSGAESRGGTFPAFETLQEALDFRAHASPSQPHLILWGESSSRTLSFADVYEGARRVALELAHRGISRGDVVALMLPTSADFFYVLAGVLLAGATPAPIYPPYRANRIEEYAERQASILSNADAKLLVTFREAGSVARLLRPRVPSLEGVVSAEDLLAGRSAELPLPGLGHSEDIALLQYTSGSTGDPKGVTLTQANLLANIRGMGEALQVRPADVCISWLPLYHDMGLIGAWFSPLCFGIPTVIMPPLDFLTRPKRWLWAFHRHQGTLAAAPNFAYEMCVRKVTDEEIEGLDLSRWRAALNGAEPVMPNTLERFAERFARYGFRRDALLPVYGLAEASLAVTFPPLGRGPRIDRIERAAFLRDGRAVPAPPSAAQDDAQLISFVSVGRPVAKSEVRIVDAEGRDLEDRREGQLWFRGPSVTQGYYRNPEATRALFPLGAAAGWINSGDRAYRDDGEFFITGRSKDIILKAGRNISPQEIEDLVGGIPGVRRGCVVAFGAHDVSSATERLVVVAETRESGAAARAALAAAITENVSRSVGVPPDVVVPVAPHCIPKTSSGKLRRDKTKQLYLAGTLGFAAPPAWLQFVRLSVSALARSAGRWVRRGLEGAYGIYADILGGALLVLAWLVVLMVPSRKFAARVTCATCRAYFVMIGSPVRVTRSEQFAASGARVLVSNHASYFDVLILMAALGVNFHFVAKGEVRTMPFIGTFLRKLGHFAFDRNDPEARLRQVDQMEQALARGESVFVFPEGTFTPQAGVRPFQLGAFQSAVRAGCPVVPVALDGSRRFLRDEAFLPRPSRLRVRVGPPLYPQSGAGESWQEIVRLRDASRAWIAEAVREPLL
jgi:acyl carrier protein